VLLDNPELFIRQMRAILRAGLHGNVRILWPMISCVDELRAAKICLEDAKRTLTEGGVEYQEDVPIGAMIEIPSAVMVADRLAAESDFLSIGTNDLVQYTLAVDRGNEKVDHLYRPHDPAVLAMIQRTVESGLAADVPVSVCGEMAGTASYIPLLLGLGVRELSATPNRVLLARRSICETDSREARGLAERVISAATVAEAGEILGISSPRG
jgi:phosphotransferase system enzyme I (PtsI)